VEKQLTNKSDYGNDNGKYIELLKKLESDRYYGEVIIKFENGNIVHVKKTESIKY
jgi:hypothetical protein